VIPATAFALGTAWSVPLASLGSADGRDTRFYSRDRAVDDLRVELFLTCVYRLLRVSLLLSAIYADLTALNSSEGIQDS